MAVSQKQLEANRNNARRSTGPKTPEGRARSRANALKHGFCSEVVQVPEDAEAVRARAGLYLQSLKPQNYFHAWVVEEVAVLTIRIDRIGRVERRERDRISLRAERFWDDDRRAEAEALGARIADDPAHVGNTLRATLHGCEWLMTRWALLAREADREGGWDASHTAMAFDLLGAPRSFRRGRPGETIGLDGRVEGTPPTPGDLARQQVALLQERMAEVADADQLDRAMAEADLGELAQGGTPELRRLRRYETTLYRRLRWCMDQLQKVPGFLRPHPDLETYLQAGPEVESEPGPEPVPAAPTTEVPAAEAIPPAPDSSVPKPEPAPPGITPVPTPRARRRDPRVLLAEARKEARRAGESRRSA
ncbi:hypothetical protein TA3x_000859 [Tundrisphaera sp. TA3]|uniref:hypothetical protein n=1 Tax=Tundrisphaera sp. TA3 TaxID=3435775 RepID=UPI003EB9BDFF